jgi:hypothetical protein
MAQPRKIETPDPLVTSVQADSVTDTDLASHVKTYNAVLRAARWFTLHAFIILVGLYTIIIAHNLGWGLLIIAIAVGLLLYGLSRPADVRRDAEVALTGDRSATPV